ncbi:MAG TPA: ATP-binding protein [Polyangiales bacterium]|nr:ATP-binding protein [Polyangiales bacterium]
MTLSAVSKGRIERPLRVLLFGTEGVGKSTFAAQAPAPIFIAAEEGTAQLDVARFPEPRAWSEVFDALHVLMNESHEYKTVVVDTLDWLEPLCWVHVVEKAARANAKIKSIEDFGFGKGYVAALDEWRKLLAAFEQLRAKRDMNVIFLAHSIVKPFKNPEDEDYDRYELSLHAKAGGLVKQWVDAVLFTRFETFANTDDKTKRTRGVSSGARVMHTVRTAAFDAKNRHDLPPTLPLDWQAFATAVKAHRPADPAKLRERITTLLLNASADVTTRVTTAVAKAGDDAAQLARIADHLAATVSIANQENAQ